MKKSTRILAILMAFAMLLGSFSVMGSAYQAYKGDAIASQYNDVDAVEFTLEQYASMGLDEVDRMLAKEKMVLDIYIGTLDISSINTALTSVISLVGSVETLLPLLGDASSLPSYIVPLEGVQRYEDTDLDVIYALLNFIANVAPLAEKYVNGTVSLGIMNSFIEDFIFDVRTLAIGLIYGMTAAGEAADYDAMDDGENGIPKEYLDETNGALTLLQNLLNELVLGEWKQLDEYFDDPYSVVMYESYSFAADCNETNADTAKYDYYGWVHPNDWVTVGLGGCVRVTEGDPAPAATYDVIDITGDKTGYEFIENLIQTAYNQLLIPVLNRDTRVWLRKLCGVEYDETKSKRTIYGDDPSTEEVVDVWYNNPNYDASYDGDFDEAANADNPYLEFLNVNARAYTVTIPEGETFVDNFNDILGAFLDNVLAVKRNVANEDGYSWTWTDGGNEYLFDNICSAGKFIVQASGNLFFSEYVDVPAADEVANMSNQQLVAFLMRAILNSSVDWMYIEDEYQTVADVGYRAVEQLAWQDIPQYTYTKPVLSDYASAEAYYDAVVEKALDILFDVAVYNLNQGFDMVPASGADPVAGEGLLQYGGDKGSYETNLIQIAAWAITEYGPILNLDFFCDDYNGEVGDLTIDHVWQDIDTIIDSLIPIKGAEGAWISGKIAGDGTAIVSKSFIFDYILKPVYYLDSTNLAEIFARNEKGAFATDNGIEIIMNILTNVFELLFPGVFQPKDTIDEVLNNELLGAMVGDLLKALGTNDTTNALKQPLAAQGKDIAAVALPLVCMILGLSDDQEFEEMEVYLAETIPSTIADATAPTFEIFNGSSGINTGYTAADGTVTQDNLYNYEIVNVYVRTYDDAGNNTNALTHNVTAGTKIAGGDSILVTLNGTRTEGNLVEVEVIYKIYGETGGLITDAQLSKTVYTYVGASNLDDDALEDVIKVTDADEPAIEYYPSIYLSSGDDLDDIESYSIRIQDSDAKNAATATVNSVSNERSDYPFVAKDTSEDAQTSVSMTGEGGVYFLNPFTVATKADGTLYERFEENYQVDEETGDLVLDDNGDPIPDGTDNGGVEDGQYNVTTNITAYGNSYNVTTMIHLYDDYGLDSLFERAVAANRQASDYEGDYEGAWNNYVAALKEAARLVLKPKVGEDFQADIAIDASTGYANRYEMLATNLENAIEALEEFAANAGTAGLKAALADYSGVNYTIGTNEDNYPIKTDIEYDDPAYVYFGMRDYVPHTYNKYRDARDRVEDLINSQQFFVKSFEEGYELTSDDKAAYDESVTAYLESVENMGVVGSIESTYAIHMLNLTGERLIRLDGDTSKLQILYDTYKDAKVEGESYTVSSEERYDRAVAFAAKVLAESDPLPSKINKASSEIVAAWKKLAKSASYYELEQAIAAAETVITVTGTDANKQKTYTVESYQALLDAYNAALNAEEDLSDTEDNRLYLAGLTSDLTTAQANLAGATSTDASFEITTSNDGVFWDAGWNASFTPRISQGSLNHEYYGQTLADGTAVDGYLVGLGEAIPDEATLLMAFSKLENVNAEVIPTGDSMYGSGTVIKLTNASTGDLMATYIVVIVGDLNGDGVADISDEGSLSDNINYVTDWEWDDSAHQQYYAAAADINNDGAPDIGDSGYFSYIANYYGYINQEVSSEYAVESYVAL